MTLGALVVIEVRCIVVSRVGLYLYLTYMFVSVCLSVCVCIAGACARCDFELVQSGVEREDNLDWQSQARNMFFPSSCLICPFMLVIYLFCLLVAYFPWTVALLLGR